MAHSTLDLRVIKKKKKKVESVWCRVDLPRVQLDSDIECVGLVAARTLQR